MDLFHHEIEKEDCFLDLRPHRRPTIFRFHLTSLPIRNIRLHTHIIQTIRICQSRFWGENTSGTELRKRDIIERKRSFQQQMFPSFSTRSHSSLCVKIIQLCDAFALGHRETSDAWNWLFSWFGNQNEVPLDKIPIWAPFLILIMTWFREFL